MKLLKRSVLPMIAAAVAVLLLLPAGFLQADATETTKAVTGPNGSYDTIAAAVSASVAGDTLQLNQDLTENVTIRKNLTLDLNGHQLKGTVTVSASKVVSVMDSATDDFDTQDGYGTVGGKGGTGKLVAAEGYMAVTEADGSFSYHRLDLRMYSVSLRPSVAGVYFTGNFGGDQVVKEQVKTYGTVLSVFDLPTAAQLLSGDYRGNHTAFGGESWVCGELGQAYGTLLTGILKQSNAQEVNQANGEMAIRSVSYVELKDGSVVFGAPVEITFRQMIENVDTMLTSLSIVQGRGIRALYGDFKAVMDNWYIPNMFNSINDYPSLILSGATAKPGATQVTVTVAMKNNPGILGAILSVSYDSSVLTLTGASNGVTATGVKYTPPARFKDPTNFVWDALDPTWTEDGTVLTLTFDVSATAAKGAYPITLSCDPYDVIDGNGAPIDFDIANAVIEVQ